MITDSAFPKIAKNIEPIKKIGEGGMGSVWLCESIHKAEKRLVAVKLLNKRSAKSEEVQSALREAHSLSRLSDHPNIVKIISTGETESGIQYIVMQYIDGIPLNLIDKLSTDNCLKMIQTLSSALKHAHRKGIIHGDVTPHNIILGNDGGFYLIDFGVAKAGLNHNPDRTVKADVLFGKARYLSPRVILGGSYLETDDFYSLGITCYEKLIDISQEIHSDVSLASSRTNLEVDLSRISDKELRKKISKLLSESVPRELRSLLVPTVSLALAVSIVVLVFLKHDRDRTLKIPPQLIGVPGLKQVDSALIVDFTSESAEQKNSELNRELRSRCPNLRMFLMRLAEPLVSEKHFAHSLGSVIGTTREKINHWVKKLYITGKNSTELFEHCKNLNADLVLDNTVGMIELIHSALRINPNPKNYTDFKSAVQLKRYLDVKNAFLSNFYLIDDPKGNDLVKEYSSLSDIFDHEASIERITNHYDLLRVPSRIFPKTINECRALLDFNYEAALAAFFSGEINKISPKLNAEILMIPTESSFEPIHSAGKEIVFRMKNGANDEVFKRGLCLYGRSFSGLKYLKFIKPKAYH